MVMPIESKKDKYKNRHVFAFWMALMLIVMLTVELTGCAKPTPAPAPAPAPVPAPTSPAPKPPATTVPPPTTTSRQWAWVPSPGNIVTGGSYAYFPLNGAYVEAGRTLSLSWQADGNLECFILTENQYNNFKSNLGIVSARMAYGSGMNGAISAYIQNSDRYYAVIRNTFTLGPSVKLYQAVLTEQ
jgi:hypothetical protein